MSHFSKIKTNITSLSTLCKTIDQLGFEHKTFSEDPNDLSTSVRESLLVYHPNYLSADIPVITLVWNGSAYNIVVDLQLWYLDIDFNYFVERLSQQYAYNIVLNQGYSNGFQKVGESVGNDGSIKITLKKWNS